jgi:serine/threonine protein kinase
MSTGKPTPRGKAAAGSNLDATVVGNQADDLGGTVITNDADAGKTSASGKSRPSQDLDATVAGSNGDQLDATQMTSDLDKTGVMQETQSMSAAGSSSAKPAVVSKTASATSAGKSAVSDEGKSSKSVSQIGDYKIVKKLGKGGMGEVYLAHQVSLDRTAALKVLSKQLAGKEDFIKRFYREARAMAKIDHPNAVRVYEVREDLGIHYVAMEFVDGKSLQKWMDQLGKLSVGDAVHVIMRCAEALQAAHAQSMIHRDIKPDNVMLTSKGAVKVADFGLAKALDDDLSMTQSGTGLGTPYYMAPEQARNAKHVDARADIYALGVTFYYFLTGNLPFTGGSTIEVIQNKELGRYARIRSLNPQVSERLELVVDKMIMKDPEHRFKDCAEMMKALAALGLESPSLSFIDAPDKVVATSSAAARSQASTPHVSRPVIPKSSAEDAAAKEKPMSAVDSAAMWFVQYKNPQGQDAIGKFTTPQILQMLKAGSLDPRSKAKKGVHDSFLPLMQIAEFDRAASVQMTRVVAVAKSEGLKKQFAQIDRQDKWWKIKKKILGMFSGVVGLVKFVIWLAIVFGGIGAAIYFFPTIWNFAAAKINEQQAAAAKPGDKPAENKAK